MRIALINENSQAAKNALILEALRGVVEPMGHTVDDYGMYTAEDKAQLTAWAQQYDLIITGGTDYHGMNSAHPRPVGTCTTAEEQILRIRALAQKRKQEL